MSSAGAANPPTVSIVIASHDSASFAEKAVESALAQTFEDFEIILIDDGSGPESAAILDSLARHQKIRLLRQENQGCRRARRRGWEEARGTFVAFLDDDDRYLAHYLDECVGRFRAQPEIGAVYTRFFEVDPSGRRRRTLPRRGYSGRRFEQEVQKGSVKTSTLMVRRDALLQLSGILEHYRTCGDYDIVLRLRYQHSFAFVEEPLVEVMNRPGSLSKDMSRRHLNRAEILGNLLRVFPEMRASERRAVMAKIAKYYAKAGNRAERSGRTREARALYRSSLESRWSARGVRSYLRSFTPPAMGSGR